MATRKFRVYYVIPQTVRHMTLELDDNHMRTNGKITDWGDWADSVSELTAAELEQAVLDQWWDDLKDRPLALDAKDLDILTGAELDTQDTLTETQIVYEERLGEYPCLSISEQLRRMYDYYGYKGHNLIDQRILTKERN